MKAIDYVPIIKETAIFPDTVSEFGISYAYTGIIDESDELMDVLKAPSYTRTAVVKEVGDVVWYTTALAQALKLDAVKILSASDEYAVIEERGEIYNIEKLAGKVKKFYRDGKVIDREFATTCLMVLVSELKWVIKQENLMNEWDEISWGEVLETNYNKLMLRRKTNTLHGDGDYREEQNSQDNA